MNRPGRIIFDACTLENFASVGRLDLLQALYQDRNAWTDGTELEVRRGSKRGSSAIFATDDRDAYNLAKRRGMNVIDTPDMLHECFDAGLSGCPESFDLLHKMAATGCGVATMAGLALLHGQLQCPMSTFDLGALAQPGLAENRQVSAVSIPS